MPGQAHGFYFHCAVADFHFDIRTCIRKSVKSLLKTSLSRRKAQAGRVLGRFNRFYQIGPHTLKGPRAEGALFLYCEVRNAPENVKYNVK